MLVHNILHVLQDSPVGSFVVWFQSDISHRNSTVHYQLEASSSPGFSIDGNSGVVTTASVLNPSTTYTVTSHMRLAVRSRDLSIIHIV